MFLKKSSGQGIVYVLVLMFIIYTYTQIADLDIKVPNCFEES